MKNHILEEQIKLFKSSQIKYKEYEKGCIESIKKHKRITIHANEDIIFYILTNLGGKATYHPGICQPWIEFKFE